MHRLLETIHGVIYGYDISYCPVEGTPGITQIKTPNNCFMDLNSLHCELIDDVLVISDGTGIKHDFSTDEHDLIYMDGNKLPFINYKFTDEELQKNDEFAGRSFERESGPGSLACRSGRRRQCGAQ